MTSSRMRTILIGATCTAALGVLGGCGSASSTGAAGGSSASTMGSSSMSSMSSMGSSGASSPSAASSAVVIHIAKFAYQTPASVSPGAKVTVMNMDGEAHTVTADSGSAFDTKTDPGASSTFTAPMKPGTYAFHCTFHGNMHGMLVVK
jgi:plastocyanin